MDDKITNLSEHRQKSTQVALGEMPIKELRKGPFTITIFEPDGILLEIVFPDYTGDLPPDANIRSTLGCNELFVNLLTGAICVIAGSQ